MLKVEYRDHIGFENKRLENEIHSRMTAYRAAMGGEELTMMQSWIIRFLYEHSEEDIYQRDIEAEFSIARSTATGILKLMEKRGYIRRVSVERDARLKKLELRKLVSGCRKERSATSTGWKAHFVREYRTKIWKCFSR